jgi:hypothetical protein
MLFHPLQPRLLYAMTIRRIAPDTPVPRFYQPISFGQEVGGRSQAPRHSSAAPTWVEVKHAKAMHQTVWREAILAVALPLFFETEATSERRC